jgi:HEAT repeat protein
VSLFLPQLRPTIDAALRDVRAASPRARAAAADVLSEVADDDRARACEALIALASDTEADVRFASLAAIGRLGDPTVLDAVLPRFDDEVAIVREAAVIAAGRLGDRRASSRVRRALSDERAEVRFQAVRSLADLEGADASVALYPALADDDPRVRANTAIALRTLDDDPATADRVAKLLKDRDAEVRREAALTLAVREDRRAIPELGKHLDDEEAFEIVVAIVVLDARELADDLAKLARSFFKPLELKAAAAAALARFGDPRGVPVLRDVLNAFRPDGRTYVAESIGLLGLVELADDLAKLAHRPRGADLTVVATSLGQLLAKRPDLRATLEALAARDDEAGQAARDALSARRSRETAPDE